MEPKKNRSANIERIKSLFFQAGLIVTLFGVLLAFEWKLYERPAYQLETLSIFYEVEDIPVMHREEPPEPPEPVASQDIDIVDDNMNIDDNFDIDVEAHPGTFVDDFIPLNISNYNEPEVDEKYIFDFAEVMPEFPGGREALLNYFSNNIRYPRIALETGIEGTVYVSFVVEPDGRISNVELARGIGGRCDEEAIRVVRNMPAWNPGMQGNQPVRVLFTVPVKFEIKRR